MEHREENEKTTVMEEGRRLVVNEPDTTDYGSIEVNGHTIELTTLVRQGMFADRKTPEEVMEWANRVDIYALTAAAMMWNTLSKKYVMIPKEELLEARRFPK
tara:strand:- start:144 stop:449 length:306 start_codon:yes stop_codon:yes gene_type:complete